MPESSSLPSPPCLLLCSLIIAWLCPSPRSPGQPPGFLPAASSSSFPRNHSNFCFFSLSFKNCHKVQLLSCVRLFVTPWTVACQASLSSTIFWSLLKLTSIELVMPSNHLILCRPLLLLPSVFTSIRVFSNLSVLRVRWPKYWSFSFSMSPSNELSGLISFRINWFDQRSIHTIET